MVDVRLGSKCASDLLCQIEKFSFNDFCLKRHAVELSYRFHFISVASGHLLKSG